ncbi:unnamed protein product [Brachionus calyciflorus]|uniref:Tc1-like transposase DDE domain-containing protein n=1 Tax=Brachionus calyciflorus TaxID=104777 RepID=A0A814FTT3_9BILA|nr:unnamed protein product [Brachionus calyciflorus]
MHEKKIKLKIDLRFSEIISNLYRQILSDYLIPFGELKFDSDFKLHQDNDPKHSSVLCKSFLALNEINWIKSPPKSPDLNPIELLWNEMKTFVRKKMVFNESDVMLAVKKFESSITLEKCIN